MRCLRSDCASSLPELAMTAGLWCLVAGLLLASLVNGKRALDDANRAASLCLLAASLDKEIRSAERVLGPPDGLSSERLTLGLGANRSVEYEVRDGALLAIESSSQPPRVLARNVAFTVFHYRSEAGGVVRYLVSQAGVELLSSCAQGGVRCPAP
ncbi:MAG: hypothetical protein HY303_14460 [Candidatus Wallbacteria bacterium]|nr:hypothetical protein [Candidatus Wallbacteria bacterium]